MNLELSKKQLLLLMLGIILAAVLAFGGYYIYLKPLNDKLDRKQTEYDMASQQLTTIENQLHSIGEETSLSTMNLQRQVPVDRMLEHVMLTFEKAEIMSDVLITEIRMNSNAAGETIQQPQGQVADENDDEEQSNDEETEKKPTTILGEDEEPPKPIILPEGMMKIALTITGDADTFFELEDFVQILQNSRRIIKIDRVSLSGKEEIKEIKDIDMEEDLHFELTVSAFYFPTLTDLINELPPLDTPKGADKKNPLYSSYGRSIEKFDESIL